MEYPKTVVCLGRKYHFDMVAPLTGDGIYKNVDHTQTVRHALLINQNSRDLVRC